MRNLIRAHGMRTNYSLSLKKSGFSRARISGSSGSRVRPVRNGEAQLQAEIVAWVRETAPQVICFAVPNDGLVSKAEASKRRWTGVLAGVPDLCVIVPPYGEARFLEVKRPGCHADEVQVTMIRRLVAIGARSTVVRSVEDVRQAFERWGIVFSETTAEEALQGRVRARA